MRVQESFLPSGGAPPTTPMMQQYFELKGKWPDCILFFRLGDFYEMFFEDARLASRELELTLTGRDCGMEERAPMCGVPFHAAEAYISRLVSRGYKVAICEQVEDPALAKGLVRRDVIRVVSPGTVTDTAMLDERRNNWILCVFRSGRCYGLAAADLTTGLFDATLLVTGATDAKLFDEIARYAPSEILSNPGFHEDAELVARLESRSTAYLGRASEESFSESATEPFLNRLLSPAQQESFASNPSSTALWGQAAGALAAYLSETQRTDPSHFHALRVYSVDDFMTLDASARKNLEITESLRDRSRKGTLLWAVDRTVTSMGGRLLRRVLEQPLLSVHDIRLRQEAVAEMKDRFLDRQELREALKGLADIERLTGKAALGSLNAREAVALRFALSRLPYLRELAARFHGPMLDGLLEAMDQVPDLSAQLESALADDPPIGLKEGGLIRAGFDAEVDRLRSAATDGKGWIAALETTERERTAIRSLKVGYNRVFGYYIEVTKSNLTQVPDDYQRRQTTANGERYITPALKEMEDTILGAEQRSIQLEYDLFCGLRERISAESERLLATASAVSHLDLFASLAELADREGYCRPDVDLSDALEIDAGRHPVVEQGLGAGRFVPNDTSLDLQDNRLMVLTGPNMAGKSTYMRQVALIALLAQTGSFVPARRARIGIVDRIFTRVGASDDLASGQSTFMVEMSEVAGILAHATRRSLLILDEIGRGTSTYDGLSIAWAVIEYVSDVDRIGARTLFATHYHELTDLEGIVSGVVNYRVAVDERSGEVVFLHRIEKGGSDDSYGIEVARLAGVPDAVVQRSRELLATLEKERGVRDRLKVRKGAARPMDGQIDLFAASMAMKAADGLLDELKALEVSKMTPLDAMNVLYDLQQRARRNPRNG